MFLVTWPLHGLRLDILFTRRIRPPTIDLGAFGLASSAATSAGMAAHLARGTVSKPNLAAEVFRCADDAFASTRAAISADASGIGPAAASMAAAAQRAFWSAVSIDATGVETRDGFRPR